MKTLCFGSHSAERISLVSGQQGLVQSAVGEGGKVGGGYYHVVHTPLQRPLRDTPLLKSAVKAVITEGDSKRD